MAARPNQSAHQAARRAAQMADAFRQGREAYGAGRLVQAIRALSVAVQSPDPKVRVAASKLLGHALHRAGRDEDALGVLRRGEADAPGDPEFPMVRALALRQLGRAEQAADASRRALEIDPAHPGATAMLIDVLVRLGRDDEAASVIARVDASGVVDPYVDIAFATLAMRAGRSDDAIERLRRHESPGSGDQRARSEALFALGDALDASGRFDEAWGAYEHANAAQDHRWDPDHDERVVASITRVWTPEAIARCRASASDDERPVLVVGMPRSGTTVVEQILGRHPRARAAGELRALMESAKTFGAGVWSVDAQDSTGVDPEKVEAGAAQYLRALDRVGGGKARVIDKMPMNVMLLGYFAAAFPRGTIIHVRRDPRDVCLSCYFRNFQFTSQWSYKAAWLTRYYRGYAALIAHWRGVFAQIEGGPRVHEVRYEDLVRDPEAHARALVEAAGLGWDGACLDIGAPGGDVRTLRADQVGKGIHGASVARHERYAAHIGDWASLTEPTILS